MSPIVLVTATVELGAPLAFDRRGGAGSRSTASTP